MNFITGIFADTGNILWSRERIAVIYIYCSMFFFHFFFCCGFECVKNVFRRMDREFLIMKYSSLVYFSVLMTWKCISVAGNRCCVSSSDVWRFIDVYVEFSLCQGYFHDTNFGYSLFQNLSPKFLVHRRSSLVKAAIFSSRVLLNTAQSLLCLFDGIITNE